MQSLAGFLSILDSEAMPHTCTRPEISELRNNFVSVVIPIYNEAEGVDLLIKRVLAALETLPCELILVDDGSTDDTPERLRFLRQAHPEIRILRHGQRRGKTRAAAMGISVAQGH